jgi:hypothetical protein
MYILHLLWEHCDIHRYVIIGNIRTSVGNPNTRRQNSCTARLPARGLNRPSSRSRWDLPDAADHVQHNYGAHSQLKPVLRLSFRPELGMHSSASSPKSRYSGSGYLSKTNFTLRRSCTQRNIVAKFSSIF